MSVLHRHEGILSTYPEKPVIQLVSLTWEQHFVVGGKVKLNINNKKKKYINKEGRKSTNELFRLVPRTLILMPKLKIK